MNILRISTGSSRLKCTFMDSATPTPIARR
jgi:hypothetical protein